MKIEQQEKNLEQIKEANSRRYQDECENLDIVVPTPPKKKPHVDIEDDSRLFLTKYSLVKVESDTSPGNNHPTGFSYIKSTFVVRGSAHYDVKYTPGYDGG